jgi:hypothetical protein
LDRARNRLILQHIPSKATLRSHTLPTLFTGVAPRRKESTRVPPLR